VNPERLHPSRLARLPPEVAVPRYDRARVTAGIVHLGVGSFHRAHQALYVDELLASGETDWGISGVGLLPQDAAMAQALGPQDLLYTLVERDDERETARVVGSLCEYLHAPGDPEAVLARLTDPATRLVTLTVTESGYFRGEDGELQESHPDLRRDLERLEDEPPVTLHGYLATALARRRREGASPFTVLSCDNVQGNGELMRRMLTAFASLRDPQLGRWIDANVAFPSSMVDRITPATTDRDRDEVRRRLGGLHDEWPVVCEPFRQWVIEDRFVDQRPPLARVGVRFTTDVAPYERMKILLLNGTHQALAHVGLLLGHRTSDAALRDEPVRRLCARYLATVRPLVDAPPGIDLEAYGETLLRRFASGAVADQLERIASDASTRIATFVVPSAAETLARGGSLALFGLIVAAWMRWLAAGDDAGMPVVAPDPLRDRLLAALRQVHADGDPRPFLRLRQVFGALGEQPALLAAVHVAHDHLRRRGGRATLLDLLGRLAVETSS